MLNILLVEDDLIFAKSLKKELENLQCRVAGICRTAEEAIAALDSAKVELALIDIQLEGRKTGIDVARHINRTKRIPFIFLSDHHGMSSPWFSAANSTRPANYLPKGFLPNQLPHFIEMALLQFAHIENGIFTDGQANCFIYDELFVKEQKGGKWKKILADEITHITVAKPVCKIYVSNNPVAYTVRNSLEEVLKKFKTLQLLRIHQSHAVNIHFVNKYDPKASRIILQNTVELPVGRTYKTTLPQTILFLE